MPAPSASAHLRTFLVLLAASLVLLAAVFFPLWKPLLLALVLAGALGGWEERLARRLGRRPRAAAGLLLVGVVVVVLIPVAAIVTFAVKEAVAGVQAISAAVEREGIKGLIALVPDALRPWVQRVIAEEPAWARELVTKLPSQGLAVINALAGLLSATGTIAFETVMMLIALYFLLVDGPRFSAWLRAHSPLGPEGTGTLFEALRSSASWVLFSAGLTAAAQAVVALAGYLLARVPHPLFFASLTFFAAFIPSIGTTLISLPLAGFLLLSGHWVAGSFLAAWSLLVTGTIDNVLKPWVARGGSHLHGGLIFFSMIGGILIFGPLGLILGPVSLSAFRALVELGWREVEPRSPPV